VTTTDRIIEHLKKTKAWKTKHQIAKALDLPVESVWVCLVALCRFCRVEVRGPGPVFKYTNRNPLHTGWEEAKRALEESIG